MNTDRFKFRVWDNDNKIYAEDWDDDSFIINRHGTLVLDHYECLSGKNEILFPDDYGTDRYLLEQCTGLKDKKGELIYEGDVVVVPNTYPFYDDSELNYIGIIEYDDEGAMFVLVLECVNPKKRGISSGIAEGLSEYEELEIIGNIHEQEGAER